MENVYAPPVAIVAEPASAVVADEFYVVGRTKFALLFVATLGGYQLYWAYRHWKLYGRFHKQRMRPALRALFQIFYTHSLALRVDASLQSAGHTRRWWPRLLATAFVLAQLVSAVLDRMASYDIGSPTTDLVSLGMLLPLGGCMWTIQAHANRACGDAEGLRNRQLTWANWLWLAAGGLLWSIVVLGLLVTVGVIPAE